MPPCPNCGRPVPDGAAHCPNCGAEVRAAWPPAPEGQEPPAVLPPNSIAIVEGLALGCFLSAPLYAILGVVAYVSDMARRDARFYPYPQPQPSPVFRYGTWTINLVPLALVGLLYFGLRPRYPSFARGLGYCLVVILGLLLYGLATCRN